MKIIDVDGSDYKLSTSEKDQALKDFVTEISILRALKDSKAKNINVIHEAFSFHSQLWIISEYCPGGSVHTLMRASKQPGLEEKFIIAISRELALALKYVHEAGIIHRDVKCANVLITQDGQLQLADFGVSGVLESNVAKRSTIIGTPYWMAPELHGGPDVGYGTEIDCWAFGCTVYEMATGQPPNAKIAPKRLHLFLQKAPRLEDGEYSPALREFVSFCLEERPEQRPSAEGILRHSYVANTSKKYPTSSLRQMIERYASWERSGGQRASLWQPLGAATSTSVDPLSQAAEEEWNFSTTDDFTDAVMSRFAQDDVQSPELNASSAQANPTHVLSPYERAQQEQRARRGGAKMARLFDENAEPYEYSHEDGDDESSDLPFRRSTYTDKRETMIDLDEARASQDFSSAFDLNLADVETIRAKKGAMRWALDDENDEDEYQFPAGEVDGKRLTQEWRLSQAQFLGKLTTPREKSRPKTLDWNLEDATNETKMRDATVSDPSRLAPPTRPQLMHTTTEPIGSSFDFVHPVVHHTADGSILSMEPPDRDSIIDLDAGFGTLTRQNSIAASSAALSTYTDVTDDEPFSLEPYNDRTVRARSSDTNRSSLHAHSLSEPAGTDRSSSSLSVGQHTRGNSLSSDAENDRQMRLNNDRQLHLRNISVKASADSLRSDVMADQEDEDQYIPSIRSEMNLKRSRGPIFDLSSDLPTPAASDVEDYQVYRPTGASNYRNGVSHHPQRGRRRLDSDFGNETDSHSRSRATINRHCRVISFPDVQPPTFSALDDDAEQEAVIGELMRLLNGYTHGLEAASKLLQDEQERRRSTNNFPTWNGNGNGAGYAADHLMESRSRKELTTHTPGVSVSFGL